MMSFKTGVIAASVALVMASAGAIKASCSALFSSSPPKSKIAWLHFVIAAGISPAQSTCAKIRLSDQLDV